MSIIQSSILGTIQGLAEFLPISSSAHLVVVPYLFGWKYQGLTFDVALHFGTLIAIIAYFWKDWASIIRNGFSKKSQIANRKSQTNSKIEISKENFTNNYQLETRNYSKKPDTLYAIPDTKFRYPRNLLWVIIFATIPGAIAGALLESQAESAFRNPLLIAINLAVFGIIIWAIDRYAKRNYKLETINYKLGIFIGLAQMLAIVPGVSRSGSTMAAGRAIGLTRPDSARFSFLLAAPIMLGSALYKLKNISEINFDLAFIVSMLASLIFGFIAIKYLLKYLQKGNYAIFTWYRIILAIIVVVVYVLR